MKFKGGQILCKTTTPGFLPFLEKSESNLIWESHQKQAINNAGFAHKKSTGAGNNLESSGCSLKW